MSDVRKRLEVAAFPDLASMMEGYAQGAVETAKKDYRKALDYSAESVDILDEILVMVGESPDHDVDYEVACGAPTWVKSSGSGTPEGGR